MDRPGHDDVARGMLVDRRQFRKRGQPLPFGAADHRHEFRDLFPLIRLVAAGDGMFDAMRDVISEDLLLDPAKCGAHRRDLRHDVDAIAVLVDHFGEPADLALDPAEALFDRCLDVFSHAVYIPLPGMGCKNGAWE